MPIDLEPLPIDLEPLSRPETHHDLWAQLTGNFSTPIVVNRMVEENKLDLRFTYECPLSFDDIICPRNGQDMGDEQLDVRRTNPRTGVS